MQMHRKYNSWYWHYFSCNLSQVLSNKGENVFHEYMMFFDNNIKLVNLFYVICRMLPPIVWPISKGLGNIVSCQSHVPSATCPYHANDVNMIPLKALDILCLNLAHILVIVTVPHVDWLSRLGSKVKATASGNILVGLVADTEDICHIPVYSVFRPCGKLKKQQ